ncbi:MAG: hypothetical protein H8E38_04925 [SAR324 cluster bacterium]|nr:hypothetical protein [SAR324 cluster bacterium]MBL7035033.1 hypothetical protein [SAR324 cluster bacterium]
MLFRKFNCLICLFPTFAILFSTAWGNQPQKSNNNNPAPEILEAMIPEQQQLTISKLAEFAFQYKTTSNAVQKFLLRKERQIFLQEQLKERELTEWIGQIKKLRTSTKGKVTLEIELALAFPDKTEKNRTIPEFKISIATWNNAYTDLDYNTLILPGTDMHAWLVNFNVGDWVLFSGKSFAGEQDYLKEASPTESEAMLAPHFILKFEFLDLIDIPESDFQLTESLPLLESSTSKEVIRPQDSAATKLKKTVSGKLNKISLVYRPELTIRFYQKYRLSNYDWDYKNYLGRWSDLVYYHWRNHPPADYLAGTLPEGGEIFIQAIVKRDGLVDSYQVNSLGEVSDNMRVAALEATRLVALPPLPEEFPDEQLKIEFRFAHPPLTHKINSDQNKKNESLFTTDNKTKNAKTTISRMTTRLLKKQQLAQTRASYHEKLRQEFSSHFMPHHSFDPSLVLKIELSINRSGKVVEQKLSSPGKSVKFQLAVLNGLNQARLAPLPKLLRSETPYRLRLRVIP